MFYSPVLNLITNDIGIRGIEVEVGSDWIKQLKHVYNIQYSIII